MSFLSFLGFKKMIEDGVKALEPKTSNYVKPPEAEKEKTAHTYYRLGLTDNNRVSLAMGYSEINMNAAGIDNLIKQLELFKSQIREQEESKE